MSMAKSMGEMGDPRGRPLEIMIGFPCVDALRGVYVRLVVEFKAHMMNLVGRFTCWSARVRAAGMGQIHRFVAADAASVVWAEPFALLGQVLEAGGRLVWLRE